MASSILEFEAAVSVGSAAEVNGTSGTARDSTSQDPRHGAKAEKEEQQHRDVHYSSGEYIMKWLYQLECESHQAHIQSDDVQKTQ